MINAFMKYVKIGEMGKIRLKIIVAIMSQSGCKRLVIYYNILSKNMLCYIILAAHLIIMFAGVIIF